MGDFFFLFDVTMDIFHGKFISGKSGHTHHAKFTAGQGSFTTVKVSRVTALIVVDFRKYRNFSLVLK